MRILVTYGTTDGHTARIGQHVSERFLDQGHSVALIGLGDAAGMDVTRFDAVVLAASLHAGHYQGVLSDFVAAKAPVLAQKPTLLLSVSLAAAGHDAEDWRQLGTILSDFEKATGWRAGRIEHVAGAYRPERYDLLRRFVMKRIIAQKDPDADLNAEIVYTDWAALDAAVDAWLAETGTA
ncbi:flavodoxin domain-containing protein [Cognatishimia sp. F0-27]|uniref:flavodoxin domain-containing protein n=1 Tax=Cognatishimia sp. F0-27 TaxID=2816855 RepID=UPI001D0C029F|nr:flavodoxin domain-containing protein [Cognatishimia sp. F0-27]MCC1494874.1 protoporphyrinogen oxidase [Cognatishimia sp. F0-27]